MSQKSFSGSIRLLLRQTCENVLWVSVGAGIGVQMGKSGTAEWKNFKEISKRERCQSVSYNEIVMDVTESFHLPWH
ncbi:expressed protein [Echinococcus multilocularis]|uniref:Expressed protein n=1 Tax=Echinococcus multilocularis TaxID=6211 RepID=A0A068XYK5_ECHMU|nr:expressed protein [Echinococcus multilocularis]